MATTMPTLNRSIDFRDILASMGDDFKNLVANLTMTPEKKAAFIVEKAQNKALHAREMARQMRAKMMLIKDADDESMTVLESYEAKESKLVKLGGQLTALKNALGDAPENAAKVKDLEAQIGQVAGALQTLRSNPAYKTLEESYETAAEAYKVALNTANTSETSWKVLKDNLPMLVQAFAVYKDAQKAREEARGAAKDQFNPDTFMAGVAGDVAKAKADLRADKDVDRDLDEMKPVDPVEDLLAQHDASAATDDIKAEFEKAAAKQGKKSK